MTTIKKLKKGLIVVKYGGNAMTSSSAELSVLKDLVSIYNSRKKVVLVHGGGPDINSVMSKLSVEPKFIDGIRVTDKDTLDIVTMVLAGKVNKNIVNNLQHLGVNAVGISGVDNATIKAVPIDKNYGYSGNIVSANPQLIQDMLDCEYLPVLSTLAYSDDENIYNINADIAAARVAASVNAEHLIYMTDVDGIFKDINNKDSLISTITSRDLKSLLKNSDYFSGGMLPKVKSCIDAIDFGINKVSVINGISKHALTRILDDEKIGTTITYNNADNDA